MKFRIGVEFHIGIASHQNRVTSKSRYIEIALHRYRVTWSGFGLKFCRDFNGCRGFNGTLIFFFIGTEVCN